MIGLAVIAGAGILAGTILISSLSADRLAFVLVGALVLVMPWNGLRFAGGALADVLMVAAALALVPLIITDQRRLRLPPWMAIAAAGLLIAALATWVFPPALRLVRATLLYETEQSPVPALFTPRSSLSLLVKFEIAWLVLPLLLAANCTTRQRCERLLDIWTAAAIISALVAVLDFTGVAHLAPRAIADSRSSGLTIHPNYLAFESSLTLPLALLWFTRGGRWRIAAPIATFLLLAGVYASGSRAATVGAAVAIALTVLAVPSLRRSAAVVVPFAGMLVILLLMFTSAGSQLLQQVRLNSGNSTAIASNLQRHLAAQVAVTQLSARPLVGVGFSVIEDAHDIYLQLLAAGGVIALGSFLLYCGGMLAAARHALRGSLRGPAMACAVSIIVWLVAGVFDNQLIDKFLYIVPGLLLAMSRLTSQGAAAHEPAPPPLRLKRPRPRQLAERAAGAAGAR